VVSALLVPGTALAATGDWPQYLHGPQHSSVSLTSTFTVANAAQTHQVWHFSPSVVTGKPAPKLDASPTIVGGKVFIGSEAGVFYALNASTGGVVWKHSLDTQAHLTCPASGISATAAVVKDPISGVMTVYAVGAGDLYALKASTGALVWKTMIGPPNPAGQDASYNWSSPTVVGQHIYMGLASRCDTPLVRGGVAELDQHTGSVLNTWHSVPNGSIGGSVWSSIAASADGQNVWVSTGNECDPTINTCPSGDQVGDSNSIVHLTGSLSGWAASKDVILKVAGILTVKGPAHFIRGIKVREETEVGVDDAQAARDLVESLGYTVAFTYHKHRSTWRLNEVDVTLDTLAFGFFTELEGPPDVLEETARTMGVNFTAIVLITFAIGSGLAAFAGVMNGLYYNEINFGIGLYLGVIGFSAAIIGGLGSVYGAILGGFLFAGLQTIGTVLLPFASAYKDVFAFAVVIAIMAWRPTGLIQEKISERV